MALCLQIEIKKIFTYQMFTIILVAKCTYKLENNIYLLRTKLLCLLMQVFIIKVINIHIRMSIWLIY